MVSSPKLAGTIPGHKLSTVVPGNVTAENTVHKLTGGDLAMKLHYLGAVYYFGPSETVQGLTTPILKEPMFPLLDIYYPAAGRIRRDDAGRPHIRCNDGGVRIVEASCGLTMEEWLRSREADSHRLLVPEKAVGPDINFSPTVFFQFTRFKCGGMTVGLSWAHLLGDPVSASNFINLWGQLLTSKQTTKNLQISSLHDETKKSAKAELNPELPLSVQKVKQIGDFWLTPNSRPMVSFFIEITAAKLNSLQSKFPSNISAFETLSALLWQSIAKIRAQKEPRMVTICRNSPNDRSGIFSNQVKINTVIANSSPANSELLELAKMINKEAMDEMKMIQEVVNGESENLDVILYGSNLTFVDLESINFYGLELQGQKPIRVDYSLHGVGDQGVVLALQGPLGNGRVISLKLPEEEISQIREQLVNDWGIA